MAAVREFGPARLGFMWQRVTGALVGVLFFTVPAVFVALAVPLWPLLLAVPVLWLGVLPLSVFAAHVAFKKEVYELHGDHLVCRRGTLFSDGRTELDIRNITHVRVRLPWLRYRLFKLGDVRVESAGSSASEITFQSIRDPETVYDDIQASMRDNGFSLTRRETLHEESPGVVGALTEVVQMSLAAVFSLFWVGFLLIGAGTVIMDAAGPALAAVASALGVVVLLGVGAVAVAGLIVRYLDITRRTYTVHNDAVFYTEGFLTRDNAFIPYENIADAATNRTVIDQVLGLYDVKVSCQGSGSEINFRRLSRGPELKEAISTLVASGGALAPKKRSAVATEQGGEPVNDGVIAASAPIASRSLVDPNEAWTHETQMHMARTLVPLLVTFPLFPIWLLGTIAQAIRVSATTFTIGRSSLSSEYTFLGSKQQEFAYDKVTGVQVTRNPVDDFFKTVTVQIWSIGSPLPMTFNNILEEPLNLPALLRQCGVDADAPAASELEQSFGPKVWLIQNMFTLAFTAVAAVILVVLAATVSGWFLLAIPPLLLLLLPMAVWTAMRVKRQHVTFHAEHVEARTGVLIRQHVYARFDNIKKVESTLIPFTEQGRFKLYIAGERVVVQQQQQGKAKGGGAKIPYSLQGDYVNGITTKVDAMDALLLGKITPSQVLGSHPQNDDVLTVSRPAVGNSIVPLLFFPPLWVFIPVVIWQVKMRRYEVEADRVTIRAGILFKSVTSVLYNRIDSLQNDQGALGKAFGNGRVTLLTAGSSSPDLIVANVPDYTEVYTTIRSHYGNA